MREQLNNNKRVTEDNESTWRKGGGVRDIESILVI